MSVLAALPPAPSWFPGHMAAFTRALPALLSKTHVVLEVRDARLPLTSINPLLEDALVQWKTKRAQITSGGQRGKACERIVVYTKRDLIPSWGEEPLKRALSRHFDHHVHFTASGSPQTLKSLHSTLLAIAKQHLETTPTVTVLVLGMPNVGKSTLLNSLRWAGTSIATKALKTSSEPGLTRALSERLKLSFSPPIYAIDSPGVMVPFLGPGDAGKERGVKLALIAGIKESLYNVEFLVAYLLDRMNHLSPESPAYLSLLPSGTAQTSNVPEFLDALARRLGMIQRGSEPDLERAANWFVQWWRDGGGHLTSQRLTANTRGWGFDFDFGGPIGNGKDIVYERMQEVVDRHVELMRSEGMGTSQRQQKLAERSERTKERTERRLKTGSVRTTSQKGSSRRP